MIKKYAINKITVTSMCLILLLLFYLLPVKEKEKPSIKNKQTFEQAVYLLDSDNYVSKVITYYDKENIINVIKYKINVLTYGLKNISEFHSLIPKSTKLNDVKVYKDNVYLDFSKDLLSISSYLEENMIEAIVYTLTEINGINNIYITVEQKKLLNYPNSKKELDYPLTRKIGINREYNINSFDNLLETTIVFTKKSKNIKYYVPVTKIINSNDDKINIIIEELKSTVNTDANLNGNIHDKLKLESYKINGDSISLVFNDYIFNDNNTKKINENVIYTISRSIFENYNVNEVVFNTKLEKNITNVVKNK